MLFTTLYTYQKLNWTAWTNCRWSHSTGKVGVDSNSLSRTSDWSVWIWNLLTSVFRHVHLLLFVSSETFITNSIFCSLYWCVTKRTVTVSAMYVSHVMHFTGLKCSTWYDMISGPNKPSCYHSSLSCYGGPRTSVKNTEASSLKMYVLAEKPVVDQCVKPAVTRLNIWSSIGCPICHLSSWYHEPHHSHNFSEISSPTHTQIIFTEVIKKHCSVILKLY